MNRQQVYQCGVIGLLMLLPTIGLRAGDAAQEGELPAATAPEQDGTGRGRVTEVAQRLREGSRLSDVAGQFDFAGDRIAFFPADSRESFRVLENLSAERVSRILSESRDKPEWVVSGMLTEFRGVNYLLVSKAMIQAPVAESRGR